MTTLQIMQASVPAVGHINDAATGVQGYFSSGHPPPEKGPVSQAPPTCGDLFSSLRAPSWEFPGIDPLMACRAGPEEHDEEAEEDFGDMLAPPPEQAKKYVLRMCVHSGRGLPLVRSYVVVNIAKVGDESAQYFESPVARESHAPVWEFCFETEIKVGPDVPRVEIKVYSKRHVITDRFIGGVALPLVLKPGVPRRQMLKLAGMPSSVGWTPPHGKLNVVWQLCETARGEPDLMRVAEMGVDATEPSTYHIDVRVLRLGLSRPTRRPSMVLAKVSLIDKDDRRIDSRKTRQTKTTSPGRTDEMPDEESDGAPQITFAGRPSLQRRTAERYLTKDMRLLEREISSLVGHRMLTGDLPDSNFPDNNVFGQEMTVMSSPTEVGKCSEAEWSDEHGQLEQFMLHDESQVSLLRYRLHVAVYKCDEGGSEHVIGTWKEQLSDLQDAVEELGRDLIFDAELLQSGERQGVLRLEFDIFQNSPHPRRPVNVHMRSSIMRFGASSDSIDDLIPSKGPTGISSVPLRRGELPSWESTRPVFYYCTVWADGLPPDGSASNPYIRITMGGQRSETVRGKQDGYLNDVKWWDTVRVSTKAGVRKARIELWSENSFLPGGHGGQDTLIGQATIYDVTPGQMYWRFLFGGAMSARRPSRASLMVKGAISPASTCHGLVCIFFGGRPTVGPHHFDRLHDIRFLCRLRVRLYRGLYLEKYASKRVHVLVEVPGCRLPVHTKFGGDEFRGHNFNRKVLSFPGAVDDRGLLRFLPDAPSKLLSMQDLVAIVSKAGHAHEEQAVCSWVERSTPDEYPLEVRPGASHTYLYVVALGEEDQPPQVFGRLRLAEGHQMPPPRWKRMRIDQSVSDLPELTSAAQRTHVHNDLAGFILGSAHLIPVTEADPFEDRPAGTHTSATSSSLVACGARSREHEPLHVWDPRDVKVVGEQLAQDVVLPRGTRPISMMCRPCMRNCVGEGTVNIGSLGTGVRYALQRKENLRSVYCHVDVLAARSLPSSDEDGLSDPCFTVMVEDKVVRQDTNVPRSLNPTFMQRLVIPLEIELPQCADRLSDIPDVPLPPIVFKLLDADPEGVFSGITGRVVMKEVGTAVVKHAPNLDIAESRRSLGGKSGTLRQSSAHHRRSSALDLNDLHTPVWYSLNDSTSRGFHDEMDGRSKQMWSKQPRVLLAAGYSMKEWVANTDAQDYRSIDNFSEGFMVNLHSEETAHYKISIDILGLRNVHPVNFPGLMKPELLVSSWWEGGPVHLDVEELPNMNFRSSILDPRDSDAFIKHMKPMLDIRKMSDPLDDRLQVRDPSSQAMQHVHSVEIDQLLGVRINVPIYEVPVIPYLQSCNEGGEQYVLLPDIVFQLRSKHFGKDYGSVSALLRDFTQHEITWAERSVQMRRELPDDLQAAIPLKQSATAEDAYDVCVDVFAAASGYLRWDDKIRMGRCLTQQRLFSIQKELPKQKVSVVSAVSGAEDTQRKSVGESTGEKDLEDDDNVGFGQYFNPADWMYKGSRFLDESFDDRVIPTLTCDTEDGRRRAAAPLGPSELFEDYFRSVGNVNKVERAIRKWQHREHQKGTVRRHGSTKKRRKLIYAPKDLEIMRCKEMRWAMRQVGWRSLSHLTAPEKLPEVTSCGEDQQGLQKNLHTFVRPVGHIISPNDRDSRFLARLKMNLPHSLMVHAQEEAKRKQFQKEALQTRVDRLQQQFDALPTDATDEESKRQRTQLNKQLESYRSRLEEISCDYDLATYQEVSDHYVNFVIIKFKRPGIVIWAPPDDVNSWSAIGAPLFVVKLRGGQEMVTVTMPNFDLRWNFESAWYLRKTFIARWRNLENRIRRRQRLEAERRKTQKVSAKWEKRLEEEMSAKSKLQQDIGMDANSADRAADTEAAEVSMTCPFSAPGDKSQDKAWDAAALRDDDSSNSDMERARNHEAFYDGYSQPVFVAKNAFVCRLHKRSGNHCYDRPQTKNWYRTVLQETFEEVKEQPIDASESDIKEFFTSRFMNLRRSLVLGKQGKDAGLIKGHINVKRITPDLRNMHTRSGKEKREEAKAGTTTLVNGPRPQAVHNMSTANLQALSRSMMSSGSGWQKLLKARKTDLGGDDHGEQETTQPIEHLWISSNLNVNLYILTGRSLRLHHHNTLQVYLTAEILGSAEGEPHVSPVMEGIDAQKAAVNFYHHFKLTCTVPGATTLRVQVFQKGFPNILQSHLIGTIMFDLEDRWLTLIRRRMQALSSHSYLEKNATREVTCVDQDDLNSAVQGKQRWIDPSTCRKPIKNDVGAIHISQYIAPPPQLPIEIKKLIHEDEDTESEICSGSLRVWLDLTDAGHPYWDAKMHKKSEEFEVRITVWDIRGITVFKDFGERNDVFVRGELSHQDFVGQEVSQTLLTDTHKWARSEANFNWCWKFPVKAPAAFCTLELSILDEDMVIASEPIYHPKVLPLDHMLMLAFDNWCNGRPNLSVSQEKVIFDAWPDNHGDDYVPDCCCCWWWCIKVFCPKTCVRCCFLCRKRLPAPSPAVMRMDVEILPKEDAQRKPFQDGQLRQPKGRMHWGLAVSSPGKFIQMGLGPTNSRNALWCSCCILWILLVLLVLVTIFLFSNSFPGQIKIR